jgi:hypothetical protein
MLHFGMRPPFSFDRFLGLCKDNIPERDLNILKGSSITGNYGHKTVQPTLDKWRTFDTALRNELVKIRASRKHLDPSKYLRWNGYTEPYISHVAISAYRIPSPLEAEKALDLERWRVLEELTLGHYFDIDFLIAYAHKLLILQRWEEIRSTDKSWIVDEVLKRG